MWTYTVVRRIAMAPFKSQHKNLVTTCTCLGWQQAAECGHSSLRPILVLAIPSVHFEMCSKLANTLFSPFIKSHLLPGQWRSEQPSKYFVVLQIKPFDLEAWMDNGLGGVQTWVVIVVAVVTISISISFLINLFYLFGFKSVVSFIC